MEFMLTLGYIAFVFGLCYYIDDHCRENKWLGIIAGIVLLGIPAIFVLTGALQI